MQTSHVIRVATKLCVWVREKECAHMILVWKLCELENRMRMNLCMWNLWLTNCPSSLTPEKSEKVIDLIKRNSNCFSKHDFNVGCRDYLNASINTVNHLPISEPQHRHKRVHIDVTDETIDKMIAADIAEPCISQWAANLVVVLLVLPLIFGNWMQ